MEVGSYHEGVFPRQVIVPISQWCFLLASCILVKELALAVVADIYRENIFLFVFSRD